MSAAGKFDVLSSSQESKAYFRSIAERTLSAVLSSFEDDSAFSGINPYKLREQVAALGLIDECGDGFEKALEKTEEVILPNLLRTWSSSYMPHLHSPAIAESIAAEIIIAFFNNSMDSWDQSPAATEVEVSVIDNLLELFGYDKAKGDGTFTSGGSQSNFSAIAAARDWYINTQLGWDVKKKGLPDSFRSLRLYTSEISHFSMEKSCHMLGLGYDAVVKLPVDPLCRIDTAKAEEIIRKDVEAGLIPFCLVATVGTTDFGSIDEIGKLRGICDRYHMHLHADAAYGSGLILSGRYRDRIADISLADSITVDFHKMFLLGISCSCVLVKDRSLLDCFELHADYLNREEDEEEGYINLVSKGMQTTRRSDALKVFLAFRSRGKEGYAALIDTAVSNAEYFYSIIAEDDRFIVANRPEISSVVFALKGGDELNKQIRRKLLSEGTVIGQTVKDGIVMLKFTLLNPSLTHEHIDELKERILELSAE